MVVTARAEHQSKAQPWDARCKACGGWIATAPGDAMWVRAKCMNWRANRTLASDRRCPMYNQSQTIHRR